MIRQGHIIVASNGPHPPSLCSAGLSRVAGEADYATFELVVVGLNDRTTPIELRERVALSPGQRDAALRGLRCHTSECVIVATCNRVELYAVVESGRSEVEDVVGFLADFHGLDPAALRPHLYVRRGSAAVRHLFAVASGLDSMIVGEDQILGQVRADYDAAIGSTTVGTLLSHLFQTALRVGKQVRTVTRIGRSARSVGSAAIELIWRVRGDLREATVLVIGTGVMGEQAARAVTRREAGQLVVANRTYSRAAKLAAKLGGRPAGLATLLDQLARADIVISSTGAPGFILDRPAVQEAMRERPNRPLTLVDLALPRDVDPEVGTLENVELFDLDDLQKVGALNLEEHRRDLARAWRLVDAELSAFEKWLATREVVPTIAALRDQAEEIRLAEVRKALGRMGEISDRQRSAVEALSVAIVNKLLHPPTVRLKADEESNDARGRKIEVVRGLFGLDEPSAAVRPRGSV